MKIVLVSLCSALLSLYCTAKDQPWSPVWAPTMYVNHCGIESDYDIGLNREAVFEAANFGFYSFVGSDVPEAFVNAGVSADEVFFRMQIFKHPPVAEPYVVHVDGMEGVLIGEVDVGIYLLEETKASRILRKIRTGEPVYVEISTSDRRSSSLQLATPLFDVSYSMLKACIEAMTRNKSSNKDAAVGGASS